jgi:hypothetical protein
VPHYGVTERAAGKFKLRLQSQLFAKLANPKKFDIGFSRVRHHEIYRTPRVASNISEVRFVAVRERFATHTLLVFVMALLLSACASSDEATTGESTSQSSATVPGEKMSDEGRVTPGAAGSSASVHW